MTTRPWKRCCWWGWGDATDRASLSDRPGLLPFLAGTLGLTDEVRIPVPRPEDLTVPGTGLDDDRFRAIRQAAPGLALSTDRMDRIAHACGRSYLDLMRLRLNTRLRFPDAVAEPDSPDQVQALIEEANRQGVSLVPWGGGTSVVGGVEPVRGDGAPAVLTVDMARLDRIVQIDELSQTAVVEAGCLGPQLEAGLAKRGFTLGHFPQSFEFSTVGGWVASRSAGQNSSGYGRIDEMVDGLDLATVAGPMSLRPGPPGATGPSLKEILVGSEGTIGFITRAELAIRRIPDCTWTHAFLMPDWTSGLEVIRRLVQEGVYPTIVRLSDPEETMVTSKAAPAARGLWHLLLSRAAKWLVRKRIGSGGCLLLVAVEGTGRMVSWKSRLIKKTLRGAGAFHLGSRPGDSWRRDRFRLPYLRDDFLDRGLLVETFETSAPWSRLERLRLRVVEEAHRALEEGGTRGLVLCHVSHVYHTGASLYFSVMALIRPGEELSIWERVKARVCDALLAEGGRISHHHAIGTDHRSYMPAEWGPHGLRILGALKRELDPRGILNPGKLVPEE